MSKARDSLVAQTVNALLLSSKLPEVLAAYADEGESLAVYAAAKSRDTRRYQMAQDYVSILRRYVTVLTARSLARLLKAHVASGNLVQPRAAARAEMNEWLFKNSTAFRFADPIHQDVLASGMCWTEQAAQQVLADLSADSRGQLILEHYEGAHERAQQLVALFCGSRHGGRRIGAPAPCELPEHEDRRKMLRRQFLPAATRTLIAADANFANVLVTLLDAARVAADPAQVALASVSLIGYPAAAHGAHDRNPSARAFIMRESYPWKGICATVTRAELEAMDPGYWVLKDGLIAPNVDETVLRRWDETPGACHVGSRVVDGSDAPDVARRVARPVEPFLRLAALLAAERPGFYLSR